MLYHMGQCCVHVIQYVAACVSLTTIYALARKLQYIRRFRGSFQGKGQAMLAEAYAMLRGLDVETPPLQAAVCYCPHPSPQPWRLPWQIVICDHTGRPVACHYHRHVRLSDAAEEARIINDYIHRGLLCL